MKHFKFSIIFTVFCMILAGAWGFMHGPQAGIEMMLKALFTTGVLAILEVSLSFDNAVVNASVLKTWDKFWRTLFLTVGILVAVFGMRLLFPLLIVGVTSDMSMIEVAKMALNNPTEYSAKLLNHHAEISAFGGMFLLLVGLNYFFDQSKDEHWFEWIENKFTKLASTDSLPVLIGLSGLLLCTSQINVIIAGVVGIITYLAVQLLGDLLSGDDENDSSVSTGLVKAGIGGFIYLEVLDASFSFDGVVGAFAVTNDVVIIMLGLAIGAMFVRSMTIYLVEKETLDAFPFLEHGAHYAIVALAFIMLLATAGIHTPEVVTGLIGVAFIGWSLYSSIKANKKESAISHDLS